MLAGEEYISQELPDYASERQSFVIKLFLAFIGWTMVLPIMMAKERVSSRSDRTTFIDTSSIDQNTTSSTKQTFLSHSSKKTQRFSVLVNDTSAEDFLHSLDEEYEKNSPESRKRASWFSGQQIKVGIDGGFVGYWSARELFQDKFLEL
jgi:hypothetical protein